MNTPRNAYDALGLGNMGAVEVLEDPAIALPNAGDARNPQQFTDIQYRNADDCHLGCSNQTAGGVTIAAGTALNVQGTPTSPFKPRSVVIPSYLQVDLFIDQVTIGPFNAIEGDPVPAAGHSEVSLNQFVSWPTIQANSPIKFILRNASATDKLHVAVDIRGTRLRQ
jgi:hypothetical protein